jgi:hypothetical protein
VSFERVAQLHTQREFLKPPSLFLFFLCHTVQIGHSDDWQVAWCCLKRGTMTVAQQVVERMKDIKLGDKRRRDCRGIVPVLCWNSSRKQPKPAKTKR